jgi:protein-tyrosine phosphatase
LNKLQYLKLSYQDSTFDFNAFFDRVSMEDLYDLNILGLAGLRLEKKVPNGLNRRMEVINLSYNELTHIPEQIFDMKNLRVLKLAANNISEFDQARMAELRSLQRISLRYNCMTEFPRIFLQMKLQDVNLEHNFEIKIDDEIEAWKKNNNVKFARTFTVPNQILENLYLGNAQTAQNPHYLRKIGITHILTVAAKLPPLFPTKFQYKVIEIEDTNDDFLKKYFIECIEFIENATKGGGNVLVHCKAGVSRSATIVIAFIMKTKNMSVVDAMEFVKERRNQICLNTSFMRQLEQFSKELTKGLKKKYVFVKLTTCHFKINGAT